MHNETDHVDRWAGPLARLAAVLLVGVYCLAFLIRVPRDWSFYLYAFHRYATSWLASSIKALTPSLSQWPGRFEVRSGIFLLLVGIVVPWCMMIVLRRGGLGTLGVRRPNRIGLRVIVVGYVIALPFLIWVTRGEQFADQYLRQGQRAGHLLFVTWALANLASEHFLLHGVVLAIGRRGLRWPGRAIVMDDARTRVGRATQWCGLAQPTGDAVGLSRITRWVGLPDGCAVAIAVSGLLFAAVHIGKDPRELIVSIPNGILLAYIAYRTDTWLVPFMLHGLAALTSYLIILVGW